MRLTMLIKHVVCLAIIATLASSSIAAQTPVTNASVTVDPYRSTNVRSGPSVTFDVIDVLEHGQVVEATGRSDSFSNWLQVNLGSRRGWVAFFTVAVSGDVTSLPIVEVADISPSPTPVAAEASQDATSDLYVTAYRRVNVRTGPGTDFNILGALVPGQTADVIGSSGEANEWLQIEFHGEPGWIAYFVVTVSGDLSQLEDSPSDAEETVTAASQDDTSAIVLNQVIVITRFNTNLREQPVLGAEVIEIIPYETTLQALARTDDNRWLQVRHDDQIGWLIASLVNMGVSNIEALPTVVVTQPEATTEAVTE